MTTTTLFLNKPHIGIQTLKSLHGGANPCCQELASSFIFSTVGLYTYEHDVTLQYYPNPNPNHKKGTKFRSRNSNPTIVAATRLKGRRVAATIVGLEFLDTALYLNQYSENASSWQHGLGPESNGKMTSNTFCDFLSRIITIKANIALAVLLRRQKYYTWITNIIFRILTLTL